jgi:hypothetical protein
MPVLTGVDGALQFAVFFDVRDHKDLGMTRQAEIRYDMCFQRPKMFAEGNVLRRRDVGVAKNQHAVLS